MTLKAFVVEDNPAIRDSLIEALGELSGVDSAGHARDATTACTWLREPANHWDIVIVDLVLVAGGTGFEVLQALRQRAVTQKVIVLTGNATPDVRQRCRELGADVVFDKAMETEQLLDFCANLARAAGGH